MKDDNKPQVYYKQNEREKFIKTNFATTKKAIKELVDENTCSFNLYERTYEYEDPKTDKIVKGSYNRHDLPETTFFKYGDELFPEERVKDKAKSHAKFPKTVISPGAG